VTKFKWKNKQAFFVCITHEHITVKVEIYVFLQTTLGLIDVAS